LLLPLLLQISKSQADTGANHAVSALKFGILKKFLMLGWAVLLSDIDICVLQDPFKHLYRWAQDAYAQFLQACIDACVLQDPFKHLYR
jgi:hypothetical protein